MIFQIGQTSFKLTFSFVALVVLMLILCEDKIILYSLISSFLHEFGHLSFMYLFGDAAKKVEFSLFGMRIDKGTDVNLSYRKEIIITLGGIFLNLLFALICLISYSLCDLQGLLIVSAVNIVIAAVNSFPVHSLDMGRAVRFALLLHYNKEKADKTSDLISNIFIIIFTVFAVLYFALYGINISLIAINIYLIFITIIKKWS